MLGTDNNQTGGLRLDEFIQNAMCLGDLFNIM